MGLKVVDSHISKSEACSVLSEKFGVNRNSASHLIGNLERMRQGERYTFTQSLASSAIFLQNINRDFGPAGLALLHKRREGFPV